MLLGIPAALAEDVTIGGQTKTIDAIDAYRAAGLLVKYTPSYGASTGTNAWGYEAAVVGGKVVAAEHLVGNMAIPANGYVLSAHGEARLWLKSVAPLGASVSIDAPPPPAPNPTTVTLAPASHVVTGTNIYRSANSLILYTPAHGPSTGTNPWGTEVVVVGNKVTQVRAGYGNTPIPADGYVLSGHGDSRIWLNVHAQVGDAVVLGDTPPPTSGTPLLPDIRIKNLNKCGKGDLDLTGGDCFLIHYPTDAEVADFPHLKGKKVLKFPVLTMNVGNGPAEVQARRSTSTSTDWVAYQNVYDANKNMVSSTAIPNVEFSYAGDGHDHWHIDHFDDYWIETLAGVRVRDAAKKGYCLWDNTSYTPLVGQSGVPASSVYTYENTCGQGLQGTTAIIEGLSRGWGDTYPATLPDQGIDITGLPDGRYRVGVHADSIGILAESDNTNNVATMEVTIKGNEVTTHPETATGGLS